MTGAAKLCPIERPVLCACIYLCWSASALASAWPLKLELERTGANLRAPGPIVALNGRAHDCRAPLWSLRAVELEGSYSNWLTKSQGGREFLSAGHSFVRPFAGSFSRPHPLEIRERRLYLATVSS